jgi:hypothetical protein
MWKTLQNRCGCTNLKLLLVMTELFFEGFDALGELVLFGFRAFQRNSQPSVDLLQIHPGQHSRERQSRVHSVTASSSRLTSFPLTFLSRPVVSPLASWRTLDPRLHTPTSVHSSRGTVRCQTLQQPLRVLTPLRSFKGIEGSVCFLETGNQVPFHPSQPFLFQC